MLGLGCCGSGSFPVGLSPSEWCVRRPGPIQRPLTLHKGWAFVEEERKVTSRTRRRPQSACELKQSHFPLKKEDGVKRRPQSACDLRQKQIQTKDCINLATRKQNACNFDWRQESSAKSIPCEVRQHRAQVSNEQRMNIETPKLNNIPHNDKDVLPQRTAKGNEVLQPPIASASTPAIARRAFEDDCKQDLETRDQFKNTRMLRRPHSAASCTTLDKPSWPISRVKPIKPIIGAASREPSLEGLVRRQTFSGAVTLSAGWRAFPPAIVTSRDDPPLAPRDANTQKDFPSSATLMQQIRSQSSERGALPIRVSPDGIVSHVSQRKHFQFSSSGQFVSE